MAAMAAIVAAPVAVGGDEPCPSRPPVAPVSRSRLSRPQQLVLRPDGRLPAAPALPLDELAGVPSAGAIRRPVLITFQPARLGPERGRPLRNSQQGREPALADPVA